MSAKVAKTLDRLHWLWLALAAPFLLFPNPARSPVMLVVPALWLLHGLVSRREAGRLEAAERMGNSERREWLPVTPLNPLLLLLAVMMLVSLWATNDMANSLPKISGMVLAFGVYFAMVRGAERPGGFQACLALFASLALGMAALALAGTDWVTNKIVILNPVFSRLPMLVKGLPGAESGFSPNEIAGSLLWVIPLFLSLLAVSFWLIRARARSGVKARRVLLSIVVLLASLFVCAVFLLTQSRTGYLSLAITLGVCTS